MFGPGLRTTWSMVGEQKLNQGSTSPALPGGCRRRHYPGVEVPGNGRAPCGRRGRPAVADRKSGWKRGRALVAMLAAAAFVATAHSDGMAFKSRDWSGLFPAREDEQVAFIHHADGVQHMLLSVALEAADEERLLWIVPIPAPADAVHIDIADGFPRVRGIDPRREAENRIDAFWSVVRVWMIVPACFDVLSPSLSRGLLSVGAEVERLGLHAEVVTTESVDALSDHLRAAGVHAAPEQLAALAPYLDGKQALVIARVSSVAELRRAIERGEDEEGEDRRFGDRRRPCVRIDFPTPQPYFPLRASRTDDDQSVGLRLYVTGAVRPRSQAAFVKDARVHVYEQRGDYALGEFVAAGLMPDVPYYYTLFLAEPKTRELTDDLWFDPMSDAYLQRAKTAEAFLTSYGKWLYLPLVTLLCYTSGGLAGLLLVRKWSRPALVGLWGVLTILGLMVRLHWAAFAMTGGPPPRETPDLRRMFALLFVMFFVLQSVVLQAACYMWLGKA